MGLNYNVQVQTTHGMVIGFSGQFFREHYGSLPFLTGKLPELVAEEGWSQLVSYTQATEFLRRFGEKEHFQQWRGHYAGEMYRITIA